MAQYTAAIQKLYVAYFSRPADPLGLQYWETVVEAAGGDTSAVSAAFAGSAEYKATFAGMDNAHIVNQVYVNMFGHTADPAGLVFWANALTTGALTIDNVVTGILAGAQGTDSAAYDAKVAAATAFTDALDTSVEILGYSGATANANAKTWLATVTDDATLATAIDPVTLQATIDGITIVPPTPVTVTLTSGVDAAATGGAGADTIVATNSTFTAFDVINGGAGVDTMKIAATGVATGTQYDTASAAGASVSNVENVEIASTGGVKANTTTWTGVTKLTTTSTGTAAVDATVSNTTDVVIGAATQGTTTVAGGKAVTISLSDAAATAVSVTGSALTKVSVTGGSTVTVDNTKSDGTTAKGTTMTDVTVDGATGATIAVKGAGAAMNVNLANMTQTEALTVTNATASHSLTLGLDSVDDMTVTDAVATTVTVNATGDATLTALNAAKATKLNLSGAGDLTLDVVAGTSIKLATIAGAAATGDITFTADLGSFTNSVTTGAGADTFTVTTATVADDTSTAASEQFDATVASGAGADTITLKTSGTGVVNVDSGAGNDTISVASRGTETLKIKMGDGSDSFTSAVAILSTDSIDAGAGSDTLLLNLVGSANIGAFSNFELFDAKDLANAAIKTLDVDILASKNTVSEIIASGDVSTGGFAATLTNVGAGVNLRATGDMNGHALTVTQKAAGAMTVTVDADETGTGDTAIDTETASFSVTNATSLKAAFDTAYLADVTGETTTGDNATSLTLVGGAATSLEVVSGGTRSHNTLAYTDTNAKLTSLTVTGAQDLTLTTTNTTKLATIDASAHTGGLTATTASLADGGVIKIGSGVDAITVAASSTAAGLESVSGMEKALAVSVSTAVADATAKAAAIADADTLVFAGGAVAGALTVAGGAVTAKGILSFTGAGPATLTDAVSIAALAADGAGEVLVFQYLGDSYVYENGGTMVKLVGTTGITNIVETGTDHFFIV